MSTEEVIRVYISLSDDLDSNKLSNGKELLTTGKSKWEDALQRMIVSATGDSEYKLVEDKNSQCKV